MDKPKQIPVFELDEGARGGFFMKAMGGSSDKTSHDVTSAHRDDSYLLFVLEAGYCRLMIDFDELVFSEPAYCLIHPDQVHSVLEARAPAGWIIAFDPTVLTQQVLSLTAELTFMSLPNYPAESLAMIDKLTGLLWQTFQVDLPQIDPALTLRYLLNALLTLLAGLERAARSARTIRPNRSDEITIAFRRLLNLKLTTWKRPAQYAQQLRLSVNHLNDTVKATTGYTVSYWIHYQTMLEARRRLYHTHQTVKEIAYQLGFDDQHYFSRLFRKVTGQTPLAFRQSFRDLSTKSEHSSIFSR